MTIEERLAQAEARIQHLELLVAALQQNRSFFEPAPTIPAQTNTGFLTWNGNSLCPRCRMMYPVGFLHYCVPTNTAIYQSS